MQDIIFKPQNSAKVLVVGDIILDEYIYGETSRISPEAPVPIVRVDNTEERAGGAANVALNVSSLGLSVDLLGITGKDESSDRLKKILTKQNVTCHFIKDESLPTTTKRRIVSQHQQLIRLDYENKKTTKTSSLLDKYIELIEKVDIVILSDYAKGSLLGVDSFIKYANKKNIPVLVDPKSDDFTPYKNTTILTPNEKEFEVIVGKYNTEDELIKKGKLLCKELKLSALLVTRGNKGMTLIRDEKPPIYHHAVTHEVFDVTGAGDTVIAVLAVSIASNFSLEIATSFANTAAGLVVEKFGTAYVTVDEINKNLNDNKKLSTIVDPDNALKIIQDIRDRGKTIIMTNGCFDIIHTGHVRYLNKARSIGDFLLVAINDDDSVKRLKGNSRPINNLENRAVVLNGLSSVDLVVTFNEDTPEKLIEFLKPDSLVKGGDYKEEEIIGADFVKRSGGNVVVLPFEKGNSTTNILKKINNKE